MTEDEIHEQYLSGKLSADDAVAELVNIGVDEYDAAATVEEWLEQERHEQ